MFMKAIDLIEEINSEISFLDITISDIIEIFNEISNNLPTKNQKAAITLYIANFYNGIENILKRISKYN